MRSQSPARCGQGQTSQVRTAEQPRSLDLTPPGRKPQDPALPPESGATSRASLHLRSPLNALLHTPPHFTACLGCWRVVCSQT